MGVGKIPVKAFQVRDQEIAADGVAGADADLTAGGGGFQNLGFPPFYQVDGRLNVTKENLSFGSELYFFGAADKQYLVQFFFQGFYRLAYRGLGDVKLLGSLVKAQGSCHIVKNFI